MTMQELLDRFKNVTVWNGSGARAPHEPLLLLWAIGRVAQKKPRLTAFAAVEAPLRQLLIDFGPRRTSYHPEYPFWYLQSKHNGKIWEIEHANQLPFKKNHREPQIDELRDACGGFLPEIHRLLDDNPTLIDQVVGQLLNAHFPISMHAEIRDAVGLGNADNRTRGVLPNPDFSSLVLQAYQYRCAVCGYEASPGNERTGLEAAHIKWQQAGGPNLITNAICLCAMHRKAFDRGVLGISNHGTVLVAEKARRSRGLDSWLMTYENQPLDRPQRPDWQPHSDFIDWHMHEVFQGCEIARVKNTRVKEG